jgi:hypothetical protein
MRVSGQRHAPAALYTQESSAGTHYTGGWVGLRAGLDTGARRGSNPCHPVRSQTLYYPSYSQINDKEDW